MLARGYGRIVLTSSITGPITGQAGFAHYGASKAAMLGLMRALAVEVAAHGVTVNAVMPGNVETPGLADTSEEHRGRMLSAIPMGRFGTPRGRRFRRAFPGVARGGVHDGPDARDRRWPGAAGGDGHVATQRGLGTPRIST